jgi:CheY-like chemotaxis protein
MLVPEQLRAAHARSALSQLASHHVDLIVLDIGLGKNSGLDLLPQLCDATGNVIPVVISSNYASSVLCDGQVNSSLCKENTSLECLAEKFLTDWLSFCLRSHKEAAMAAIRILHVDDEADIREVIEISLGLDPDFVTRSCESGPEGVEIAAQWDPDIILLDCMMPVMDGPATLLALRANPKTADVPVIFMTARAQARELDRFRSLGAVGVIAKPFDPMTLAASVRDYLKPTDDPLADLRARFLRRVTRDITALAQDRPALTHGNARPHTLEWIRDVAHGLSGSGGIYGFPDISDAAADVEDAALAVLADSGSDELLSAALDRLVALAPSEGRQEMPQQSDMG